MKKSIIDEIFFNTECFSERIAVSEEYKRISDKAYGFYKKLIESLNDEQKAIFENFAESELEVCAEGETTYFKEGLKAGLLLAMECLT